MTDTPAWLTEKLAQVEASHRCVRGRTALLVIDMQHGFLDEGASLEVPKGRDIVPNIARLIEACRSAGVPLIFTEFVYAENVPCLRGDPFGPEHLPSDGGPTGLGVPSSNCLIGPGGGDGVESARTIDALAPLPGELVVQAHTYDKLYGTPLELALRSRGIDRLLLTGVTTDVCVLSTLVASSQRDFRCTVVTDGVATIDDHVQDACFTIFQNKFARLAATDALLGELKTL